jgi:hypothetical protein
MCFLMLNLVLGPRIGSIPPVASVLILIALPYPTALKLCLRPTGWKKRKELLQRRSGYEAMPYLWHGFWHLENIALMDYSLCCVQG